MTLSGIKAVIFDVDGTLLDTERVHFEVWKIIGEKRGYAIPDETILATRGLKKEQSRLVFKAALGEDFPYEAMIPERHDLEEVLIRDRSPLLKPGAAELLRYLQARGIPCAVASSTRQSATVDHLVWSGINGFFAAFVGGDMVENGKPAPDIFLLAAELLHTAPADCLVVEDAPPGIEAAYRAGMRSVLVPDLVEPTADALAHCSARVQSLAEVPAMLGTE